MAPPTPPMASGSANLKPINMDLVHKDVGFGSNTYGYIDVVKGEKKSFGVRGQGTGSDMGYMHPVEVSTKCTSKYITVNVFPTDPSFDQVADTGVFTITASAEGAQTVALEQSALDSDAYDMISN